MRKRLPFGLAVGFLTLTISAFGSDWPQWQGPDRSNASKETGLLQSWPKSGPGLLWTCKEAGVGYSGPAIVGDRLYSVGANETDEEVYALDVKNGKRQWSTAIGKRFDNGYGDGPRSTATFDAGRLYVLGGQGNIVCLDAESGKKIWTVNMEKDLAGKMMSGWGYCESALVDGDHVICSPGGEKGTLAALDKKSGNVIWRSAKLTDPAAYSSIIAADILGVRQYIQLTGKGIAGVRAKDGELLWHFIQSSYSTAVIPTAISHNGYVFATSGYGAGCDLLHIERDGSGFKAEKVYANKNMTNHHGGVIRVGEYNYGYSDGPGWVCQEFKTGKNVWQDKSLGKGSVTYADGQLYCYSERDGTVVLAQATSQGWKENGRFKIPQQTAQKRKSGQIWTHPVVANGRLYLRDQDLIFCFDVRATN
jgi:outer membrane protein assembly factor BamB